MRINVQGGTGAGCKRPLRDRATDWVCQLGHSNHGFASCCLTAGCREKRDS